MESAARPSRIVRFGPFEADLAAERLLRNGLPVRLQDQPLRLLLLLLAHPGEIVSREEMRARLWPTDSYGDFDNGLNVAVRKVRAALGDDTGRPRYIETVPRRGYRLIAPVEDIAPPPTAPPAAPPAAIAPPTTQEQPSPPAGTVEDGPSRSRTSARRFLAAACAFGLVIAVLGGVLLRQRRVSPGGHGGSAGASRRSVAVLGFRNSSGRAEDAWLSTALSEMFSTELAAGDHLRLVSGEDIVHIRLAQPKLDVDSLSTATAKQLRAALDTDLIVSGSYAAVDGGESRLVRLDVRLQDANSGEILTEVSENGTEKALFQLVGNVGERLRQKLGVSGISDAEHTQVLASMPANREAGELYSNGLVKLRAYDAVAARSFLEQSIAAEPSFPLAHAALSDAWARLGYDQRAVEEAQKAFDLSSSLLPAERLQVQARSWEVKGEWDEAAQAYRSLSDSFPDDSEYFVSLARCLTRAGKGKDALALLESRRGPGDSGDGEGNARIELAIADAASAIGDMERASQAAQASATMARAQGRVLVVAHALRTQGLALENLKQFDKAMAVTEEARQYYAGAGDRFGVGSVLEVQADVLSDRGDLQGALDKYRQELAITREVGNRRGQASALNNIALVLNQQGDLERSRAMWQQAEEAFRELGDKSNTSIVLVNIGGVLKDEGDLAGAKKEYDEAHALSRAMNDSGGEVLALRALGTVLDAQGDFPGALKLLRQSAEIDRASGQTSESSEALVDLGDVLEHQGDLAGAAKGYQEALTASQASGEKSLSAYALFGQGRIALLGADFPTAQRDFSQALQLRKELGEIFTVAETEMAIAETGLEEGHDGDAERPLRTVREVFRKAGKQEDVVAATTLLIRALLAEGKSAEARGELGALPAAAEMQSAGSRLATLLAKARVEGAAGRTPEARSALQALLREASPRGYRQFVFEARLALLALDPPSNQRSGALEALSREIRAAGFSLLLSRAEVQPRF